MSNRRASRQVLCLRWHRNADTLAGQYLSLLAMCLLLTCTGLVQASSHNQLTDEYVTSMPQLEITDINKTGHYQSYVKRQFDFAMQAFENEEFALAHRVFSSLAEIEHVDSQYYLGMLYDMGVGVKKNMKIANYWYGKAAQKGDNRAQHNLAVAYAKGDGIESNIILALKLWLQSAKQGNTDSAYNLGILYAVGHEGVARNPVQAIKWWRQAAMDGDGYAQYNLGTMLVNGETGLRNYCEAIHWWKLSVSNGVEEAVSAINTLKKKYDYSLCNEK